MKVIQGLKKIIEEITDERKANLPKLDIKAESARVIQERIDVVFDKYSFGGLYPVGTQAEYINNMATRIVKHTRRLKVLRVLGKIGEVGVDIDFHKNIINFSREGLDRMLSLMDYYDTKLKDISQLTHFNDGPNLSLSDRLETNYPQQITNKTQSLRELKALLDDGTITNEEFKKLKKEILD